MVSRFDLRLAFRFALREMRGGLRGFLIFIACIALGVGAIGGVNSVATAITEGVASQGQILLGGDMRFELNGREASAEELGFLDGLGDIQQGVSARSMARLIDQSDQTLVELKAVDQAYPLYGALQTDPALDFTQLFGERDGSFGAAAPPAFYERLGIAVGDRILLGDREFEMRSVITAESDFVSDGFGFAPRLMVSMDGVRAANLIQAGSLAEFVYKVRLPANASETAITEIRARADRDFPLAGWSVRTRLNAAPSLSTSVDRFAQFLTLVGLTSLVVGGVGVANAVRAYLDAKRPVIATFKSLGASGRLVFSIYLTQILMISLIGIAFGLVLAALMPFAAQAALGTVLPILNDVGIYPASLALGVVFGLLVTLLFALLPLGRARDIPATALFREHGFNQAGWPRAIFLIVAAIIAVTLALLAIFLSVDRYVATLFVGVVVAAFIILRLVGIAVQWLAHQVRHVRKTSLRLALGNIHRPGALTPSVVMSLGLGLTLLVALSLIDGNLRREITGDLSARAPNFFFVDIQPQEVDAFSAFLRQQSPEGEIERVPMLRGRITQINGTPVQELDIPPEGAWVLRGDRGITYSAEPPENATLSEGDWWPADYQGEPLVSFSAEEAGEIGLKLGDTITVNVLGREVTARIANLRDVQWESLGINFVMVFTPVTFQGAPHAWLATLNDPQATPAEEGPILNAITRAYPAVTSVRVKEALDMVNSLVEQLGFAIQGAASIALIASVLVLSGALAAGNRARTHDAVVLKTLGATRRTLITAFSLEYLLIGLATAIFALLAGSLSAWYVVSRIMSLPAHFLPGVAVSTVITALVLTVGIGLVGTWRVLGQKAAPVLREL